jgi:uncharacterized membrane protein YdjX (TVP38/TMEM64 family)
VSAFLGVVRDREAVIAHLDRLGVNGPLVLMGLIGLQVLIPSLPAEPPMMAAAYAYGFLAGFLMSWVVSVAASQAVFGLARIAGRPLVERLVPARLLDKWTRTAGERGTLFFLLAFVIPPVPSDILIYVAGLSEIEGWRFFVANLLGRMPMIILLALVGAYGFSITPVMIVGLTAVGILMLVAWLYYIREGREVKASSLLSETDRRASAPLRAFRRVDARSALLQLCWKRIRLSDRRVASEIAANVSRSRPID